MERSIDKEQYKSRLREYVEMVTTKSKGEQYNCPICNSGTGKHKTGAFSITPDGERWKCFACDKGGDIFNLIGLLENKPDFNDQLARAEELFGGKVAQRATAKKSEPTQQPEADFSALIRKGIENINGAVDYLHGRGFSDEIIARFRLGFIDGYNRRGIRKALIIPYSIKGNYYIARNIEEGTGGKWDKPKTDEAGAEPLYNVADLYSGEPCFITEAPLDALSIIQSGGRAVAIGGSAITALETQIKRRQPENVLVLSLDNDEPGRQKRDNIAEILKRLAIPYITAEYSLESYREDRRKDANDYLIDNPEQLKRDVAENVRQAKRIKTDEDNEQKDGYTQKSAAGRLTGFLNRIKTATSAEYTATGFRRLDAELDGGLFPGLYILGAVSSLGKTTLALQIADNIAKQGKDVIIFSLEMAANELIAKSLSRLTYTTSGKDDSKAKTNREITTGRAFEGETIDQAIKEYSTFAERVFIIEGVGNVGAEEIKKAVAEHKRITGKTPVVIIDYLQILAPYNPGASDKQNTDKAILELKRLSRDYKTPVLGISSFNRDNYNAAASMAAFKESGAIEYGSDVLIALQPYGMEDEDGAKASNRKTLNACKAAEAREIEAVILKNRNGKTGGKVVLKYKAKFNYFEEEPQSNRATATKRL